MILRAMGRETANVHLGSPDALAAIRSDLKRRGKNWLHEAAICMAEVTLAGVATGAGVSSSPPGGASQLRCLQTAGSGRLGLSLLLKVTPADLRFAVFAVGDGKQSFYGDYINIGSRVRRGAYLHRRVFKAMWSAECDPSIPQWNHKKICDRVSNDPTISQLNGRRHVSRFLFRLIERYRFCRRGLEAAPG